MTNLNGRRCQFPEIFVCADAERDEIAFGRVVRVEGKSTIVEFEGGEYSIPTTRVNVADERGVFANSLRKNRMPGEPVTRKMRGEE